MATLTIHFTDSNVPPVIVRDCAAEFEGGPVANNYELPSHGGQLHEILVSMIKASEGRLAVDFVDSADVWVMFDTATNTFDHWQGDGDNKGRGFRLATGAKPLPYIDRVDVTETEA